MVSKTLTSAEGGEVSGTADSPVSAWPITSWCTSDVPSYVSTDSRLLACRMTGYSSVMPLAAKIVRHSRAIAIASRTLFSLPRLTCSVRRPDRVLQPTEV